MELKDTIEMMQSDDYKERFKAEYYQLKIRIEKLNEMLDKWNKNELDDIPASNKELFERQVAVMTSYLSILAERAMAEEIEVEY